MEPRPLAERAPRVPVLAIVQYRFAPGEEYAVDYSADLSRTGVFVHAEVRHEVGSAVSLQITLRGGGLIEALGRVARAGLDADGAPGMGIAFERLEPAALAALEAVVGGGAA
ncbi:MAG TPA: PilZ domain-containing protein [Anaeromyxobacteraceae bacterium]|jgi:hypothetical protein|nr:PilZ domain-containing protein [Anaeromyxobacteraceae bacterium]